MDESGDQDPVHIKLQICKLDIVYDTVSDSFYLENLVFEDFQLSGVNVLLSFPPLLWLVPKLENKRLKIRDFDLEGVKQLNFAFLIRSEIPEMIVQDLSEVVANYLGKFLSNL